MHPKLKVALGVIAGIVAGSVVIFAVQILSPHAPPEGLDFNDKTAVGEWVNTLPMSAFVIVLLAYFLGSIAAGYVANFLARGTGYRPALLAGFGLFVAGVLNMMAIPHPIWFAVASSLLYFAGAWLGGRMVGRQ